MLFTDMYQKPTKTSVFILSPCKGKVIVIVKLGHINMLNTHMKN